MAGQPLVRQSSIVDIKCFYFVIRIRVLRIQDVYTVQQMAAIYFLKLLFTTLQGVIFLCTPTFLVFPPFGHNHLSDGRCGLRAVTDADKQILFKGVKQESLDSLADMCPFSSFQHSSLVFPSVSQNFLVISSLPQCFLLILIVT